MATRILVIAERRAGEIKQTTFQAMHAARRLADAKQGSVDVLAMGTGAADLAERIGGYGGDRLFACEDAALDLYAPEAYASTAAEVARSSAPEVVLASATIQGRDVSARLSAMLGSPCLPDVVAIEWAADGSLTARRPVYSGKASARVSAAAAGPVLASLRPNAFPAEGRGGAAAELVRVTMQAPPSGIRVRATRLETPEAQDLDVAEARVIVSGGRGLKAPENFALVRDLADALGGAVGA